MFGLSVQAPCVGAAKQLGQGVCVSVSGWITRWCNSGEGIQSSCLPDPPNCCKRKIRLRTAHASHTAFPPKEEWGGPTKVCPSHTRPTRIAMLPYGLIDKRDFFIEPPTPSKRPARNCMEPCHPATVRQPVMTTHAGMMRRCSTACRTGNPWRHVKTCHQAMASAPLMACLPVGTRRTRDSPGGAA